MKTKPSHIRSKIYKIENLEEEDTDMTNMYISDDDSIRDQQTPKRKHSKKGRPRKIPENYQGVSSYSGSNTSSSIKTFQGLIMVYRCPFAHCNRFYATKLALRRHFGIYMHLNVCDELEIDALANSNGMISDIQRLNLIKSMPRLYKCPLLECNLKFSDLNGLCHHFNDNHHVINWPNNQNFQTRMRGGNQVHDLMEWTDIYDDAVDLSLMASYDLTAIVPDMYNSREDRSNWILLSIFDCIGPKPTTRKYQLLMSLRELLLRTYNTIGNATDTLIVNEDGLRIMVMIALMEIMPKGFLTSREYFPSQNALMLGDGGFSNPFNDEEYIWSISKESVLSMLKFGAVHSSRSYVKKTKMKKKGGSPQSPHDSPADEVDDTDNDRFICQLPGCGRMFGSLPAYKYHMNHYEHDLQALIESSYYIRSVIFQRQMSSNENEDNAVDNTIKNGQGGGQLHPNNWFDYNRIVVKFISEPSSINYFSSEVLEYDEKFISHLQIPLINLIYSVNDVVHLLHGYFDQQLPVVFSWVAMRKRGEVTMNSVTNEFCLIFKRDDNLGVIRSQWNSPILSPTLKKKRSLKKDSFPSSPLFHNSSFPQQDRSHLNSNIDVPASPSCRGKDDFTFTRSILGIRMEYLANDQVIPYQKNKTILQISMESLNNVVPLRNDCGTWLDYSSFIYRKKVPLSSILKSNEKPDANECLFMEHLKNIVQRSSNLVVLNEDTDILPLTQTLVPFSNVLLNEKNVFLYNNGSNIYSVDWFPYIHPVSSSENNRFIATLVSSGSNSSLGEFPIISSEIASGHGDDGNSTKDKTPVFMCIWSIILLYSQESSSYVIEEVKLNKLLVPAKNMDDDEEKCCPLSGMEIVSLKWYPFVLQSESSENELRGLLAVLYSSGEVLVYSLEKSLLFPQDISLKNYESCVVGLKEVCKISIPSYCISCICWNKQQTSISHRPGITIQMILGTKEGYLGVCDLSMPTNPQIIMIVHAHENIISSVDWSPLNPLSMITASYDGAIHLWNYENMFHKVPLMKSKGPFYSSLWLFTKSSSFGRHDSQSHEEFSTSRDSRSTELSVWDPLNYVLAVDDSSHPKLINIEEPERMYKVNCGKTSKRPFNRVNCSIYGNGRFDGSLIAMTDWNDNRIQIISVVDPKKSSIHTQDTYNYSTISILKYDAISDIFTVHMNPPRASETEEVTQDECGAKEEIGDATELGGMISVSWHPLPIGMFAAISSNGLIQVHMCH